MKRVLILESNQAYAEELSACFAECGYEVCGITGDGEEGAKMLEKSGASVVVVEDVRRAYGHGRRASARDQDGVYRIGEFCGRYGDRACDRSGGEVLPHEARLGGACGGAGGRDHGGGAAQGGAV